MPSVKVGDKLYLNVQLFDGDSTKYVRAFLRDASNTVLPGSPVNLTNRGSGLYDDSTLMMPDTSYVSSIFKVYNDSSYSILSEFHADTIDIFDQIPPAQEIMNKLDEIINTLNTLLAQGISKPMRGVFFENRIKGLIQDAKILKGEISQLVLRGKIIDEQKIDGILNEDTFRGNI